VRGPSKRASRCRAPLILLRIVLEAGGDIPVETAKLKLQSELGVSGESIHVVFSRAYRKLYSEGILYKRRKPGLGRYVYHLVLRPKWRDYCVEVYRRG